MIPIATSLVGAVILLLDIFAIVSVLLGVPGRCANCSGLRWSFCCQSWVCCCTSSLAGTQRTRTPEEDGGPPTDAYDFGFRRRG